MIIKNSEFTVSAVSPKQYPIDDFKEIVLVGKSNVGKSSFINTLVNRKKLARTSSEPGKTRLINFYKVQGSSPANTLSDDTTIENNKEKKLIDKHFYIVDLPGYGYSKMSHDQQVQVGNFIEEYLRESEKIALVVFLLDIRHDPSKDDKLMYNYIMQQNIPCLIIANKADKIAITKVDDQVHSLQSILNPLHDLLFMPFSAERKIYTDSTWAELEKYI